MFACDVCRCHAVIGWFSSTCLLYRDHRRPLFGTPIDRKLELVARRFSARDLSGWCRALGRATVARVPDDAGDDTRYPVVISVCFSAGKLHHVAGTEFLWRGPDLLGTRQFVGSIALHRRGGFRTYPLCRSLLRAQNQMDPDGSAFCRANPCPRRAHVALSISLRLCSRI